MGTCHCHPPGQFRGPPLSALSYGCHSLWLWKGTIFTRTGNSGHKGGPGTAPLHGLSCLAPGQTQAETFGGEAPGKACSGPTLASSQDGNGMMPAVLRKGPGRQRAGAGGTGSGWHWGAELGHVGSP